MTRYLIPAYVYPTVDPSGWRSIARLGSDAVAVINPNNGPGARVDSNYLHVSTMLRDAGVTLVGYTDTAYAARPAHDITADLARYHDWYGIDGLFLDQTPYRSQGYVSELATTLRAVRCGLAIANAGCPVTDDYLEMFNVVVTFENTYDYLQSRTSDDSVFRPDLSASLLGRVAHLVYDVPVDLQDVALAMLGQHGAAYVGLACDDAGAPWCSLTAVSHLT